jgi:RNA polymerase sigma-70 factor (ECF subfamily)
MIYNEPVIAHLIGPKTRPNSMDAAVPGISADTGFTIEWAGSDGFSGPTPYGMNDRATDEIETLMRRAASLGEAGAFARSQGEETAAGRHFRAALDLVLEAANRMADGGPHRSRLDILRTGVVYALDCGEPGEARRLVDEVRRSYPEAAFSDEWAQFQDIAAWPDAWLIAAVRGDPPDVAALDVLAERHWKPLFGRCQMLTMNQEKAGDLAQQAWCRVLRVRNTLKPGGNFPAYLATTATNIWRDSHRSARRAGPLADHRMASLDAGLPTEDGETVVLRDTVPDLSGLGADEQELLALDIDEALNRLTPLLRDVLVSRFLTGESCAQIGQRYGRTEQTVSAWVRAAVQQMKLYFKESEDTTARTNPL